MAVSYEADGYVGYITLDKPPANSYDKQFMEELEVAINAAAADDDVAAVIVRSASEKFFCAGADIKAFAANTPEANMEMIEFAHEVLASIARVPKVFIAQIQGHALGGGLEIALACDLRFGSRGTYKVGLPEVTLGLLPGNGGTQRLPRIIGVPAALDMMITGQPLSPEKAHTIGIINQLFPVAETAAYTRNYASALARGATVAIGEIKLAIHEGTELPLGEALAREREGMRRLFDTADSAEGFAAFTEKRKPEFQGV